MLAGYLLFVMAATLAPLSGSTYAVITGFDKIVHVVLFGGVALILSWNLRSYTLQSEAAAWGLTTLIAAAIEVVQSMLWYRSGDWWDLIAGAAGALLGVIAALIVAAKWRQPSDIES